MFDTPFQRWGAAPVQVLFAGPTASDPRTRDVYSRYGTDVMRFITSQRQLAEGTTFYNCAREVAPGLTLRYVRNGDAETLVVQVDLSFFGGSTAGGYAVLALDVLYDLTPYLFDLSGMSPSPLGVEVGTALAMHNLLAVITVEITQGSSAYLICNVDPYDANGSGGNQTLLTSADDSAHVKKLSRVSIAGTSQEIDLTLDYNQWAWRTVDVGGTKEVQTTVSAGLISTGPNVLPTYVNVPVPPTGYTDPVFVSQSTTLTYHIQYVLGEDAVAVYKTYSGVLTGIPPTEPAPLNEGGVAYPDNIEVITTWTVPDAGTQAEFSTSAETAAEIEKANWIGYYGASFLIYPSPGDGAPVKAKASICAYTNQKGYSPDPGYLTGAAMTSFVQARELYPLVDQVTIQKMVVQDQVLTQAIALGADPTSTVVSGASSLSNGQKVTWHFATPGKYAFKQSDGVAPLRYSRKDTGKLLYSGNQTNDTNDYTTSSPANSVLTTPAAQLYNAPLTYSSAATFTEMGTLTWNPSPDGVAPGKATYAVHTASSGGGGGGPVTSN